MIHLRRREQGLLTPLVNPDHIRGPADLRGLLTAMRPFGAGTRVLLHQLLAQTGIDARSAFD
jgi:molybdate-binding protein